MAVLDRTQRAVRCVLCRALCVGLSVFGYTQCVGLCGLMMRGVVYVHECVYVCWAVHFVWGFAILL